MKTVFQLISQAIRNQLDKGIRHFVIFPYGDMGCLTRRILEEQYGIHNYYLVDNTICKYNPEVHSIEELGLDNPGGSILYVCANMDIYDDLLDSLRKYEGDNEIVEVFGECAAIKVPKTIRGKHSYGPLCNHIYVEKVGAFCSFAHGSNVVGNHPTNYISTHPIMYWDKSIWEGFPEYSDNRGRDWFLEGIRPKGKSPRRRITIGNDVWLGENVLITNYSNIGDGVIAGAGTVITKDVPDYAIVVGVPARIIRYRYNEKQIKALKRIAWWDWTDDEIRARYDDLLLDVNDFIRKYDTDR